MKQTAATDAGVIIGRFQVHQLHDGHIELIDTVNQKHDRTLIFVGLSPLRNTTRNPLDFNARKRMILERYPEVEVYYVDDVTNDTVWSKNLDREINRWLKPGQTATLYGGRDSFIDHYHGSFPTEELEPSVFISGAEIRHQIAVNHPPTKDFRAGVISASFDRYPTSYATVDVAVLDMDKHRLLLGQKSGEKHLRFLGGFASPGSLSYEEDAKREVREEAGGIEIGDLQYIGSCQIDDWRYHGEVDKIKTMFFAAQYMFGMPEAGDDIAFVTWVPLLDVITGKVVVMEEHRTLMDMLRIYLKKYNKSLPIQDKEIHHV